MTETTSRGASVVRSDRRNWKRDYPPLLAIGVGLLIVLAVLPSSLNLPQTNPSETLEYAPVPPDDVVNAPPAGNLGSLGLGTTSGIADAASTPPPSAPVAGLSKDASAKRCVGNPPRQTEDPFSPPCVAFFEGDNFGATYQGRVARGDPHPRVREQRVHRLRHGARL